MLLLLQFMNVRGIKKMNYILIAITSGMLMTSSHENEEACLGRKAMLEKDKIINSKCVDMRQNNSYAISGSHMLCVNGICGNK